MGAAAETLCSSSKQRSRPGSHLQVEAGEADCVVVLLFTFSLLKTHKQTKPSGVE